MSCSEFSELYFDGQRSSEFESDSKHSCQATYKPDQFHFWQRADSRDASQVVFETVQLSIDSTSLKLPSNEARAALNLAKEFCSNSLLIVKS